MRDHSSRRGGITVNGSGSAGAPVDQVEIRLAVAVLHPDAGHAFRAAADGVTRILQVLADGGVDSRSVRTTDITLGPRFDHRDGLERVLGYTARQDMVVMLHGLSGVDRLLSDIVAGGGDLVRIDGVSLTVADTTEALVTARERAFADASAKALHLATLAGRALGAITWIDEQFAEPMGRQMVLYARAASDAMPLATGDTTITAGVTAHWAFAD